MERLSSIDGSKMEALQVRFHSIDKNNDGRISRSELLELCQLVGVETTSNIETIIEKFDEDKDGKFTFGEFIKLISEIENESMAPKEEIDMIVRAFQHHDLNKDGYLTK